MEEKAAGVCVGIVNDLNDPDNLGRVRVKFPHLGEKLSDWARPVSLMAGNERGTFFRPEVGDEVIVIFEHGDPRFPYIVGSVWSRTDKTPPQGGSATDNNWRIIKSRSGHIIKLNDKNGAETIEIIDKDGSHKVVIDSANKKIKVTCDNGDVEVSASQGTVKIDAMTVEVKSSGNMSLEATGTMTIKGATVNIN